MLSGWPFVGKQSCNLGVEIIRGSSLSVSKYQAQCIAMTESVSMLVFVSPLDGTSKDYVGWDPQLRSPPVLL